MVERLKLWQQKLLDTGKRNKLLNFKETKRSTLKITYPETEALYSDILSGNILKFPLIEENEKMTLLELNPEQNYKKGFIYSTKSSEDLNKTLYQLRSRSKTALEELGINILYLAFGFLNWSEIDYSNEIIKSPLLLIPVELKKESVLSPYTLSLYDDDIVINPTLCYKLDNDFNIQLDFDIDQDDFSLQQLFNYISEKVNEVNWTIDTSVQLSLFSFLKLNMYKDLEINESKILENNFIRALCGESSEIESVPQEIAIADKLDEIINPVDTFQVVDADSSQQQAILAAKKGISFVLQGPPGTGKSQTITNIIAECLAEGKKVLFVSEKMAALEVVYRNLQSVGLEDFCLQLHSHKANKALVVKELADTLNKPKTQANTNLIGNLEDLCKEKEFLNNYDKALHEIRTPLGASIFHIHGEIAKLSKYPDIQFKIKDFSEKTSREIKNLADTLNTYTNSLIKVGENYKANCFYGFCKSKLSYELQKDYALHISNFITSLDEISQIIQKSTSAFALKKYESIEDLTSISSLLTLIIETPNCPNEWLLKAGIMDILTQLKEIQKNYQTISEKEIEIFCIYEKEILEIDAVEMLHRFKGEFSSVFRIINKSFIKDKNILKGYTKDPKHKLKYVEIIKHLESIKQIHELNAVTLINEAPLKECFGESYDGRSTNWDYLIEALRWISSVQDLYGIDNISNCFAEKVCDISASEIARSMSLQLDENIKNMAGDLNFISPLYDTEQYNISKNCIKDVLAKFTNTLNNIEHLTDWIDFINAKNVCVDAGLNEFLDETEAKNISAQMLTGTMLKRFYLLWIDKIYEKESVLAEFRRERFEHLISNFQVNDKSQFGIAQVRIRQKLSSQRPDIGNFTSKGTEIHTLIRESEKRRKILPVRKLFKKIPNLLLAIKPCLLMSPLSVSLFLDPELYQFDTVIFDEASQVRSENAIGAIYRGKQLIVVGDREQLPPTNFFNTSTTDGDYDIGNDDDDEDDVGSYESILDECGNILNKLTLLWHYRSRHEDLIAYSNAKIYKNLITFPTPIDKHDDLGVEFIYVPNGLYERSTSRSNKIEAKKVAEIVMEHFTNHPERSLGIVTFSQAQQIAIDNEILETRKTKPQYENFFDEKKEEYFFIKNLENVQGDERDTIIFSVGYGKDQSGKLPMSFGPLNRDGGYRRLNVAITRAKYNVKLVSSILPTDIDLTRTESQGVRMLRGYMDFAKNGMDSIIGELTIPEELQFDSPFEMQVYDVLKNAGFEVDTQVGCSGYRIDLAVRHPSQFGKYIIAIECDGATYHSAKTARERDRLREDVLKMRGWEIYRIWSTDWIRHRSDSVERLLKAVNDAVSKSQSDEISLPEFHKMEESTMQLERVIEAKEDISYFETYTSTNIRSVPRNYPKAQYHYEADVINLIINTESPIHKETIYRYMAPVFGREKITSVVIRLVDTIIKNYCNGNFVFKDDFYWSKSMKTPVFRIPKPGYPPRDIKLIATEEIAEGMKLIINRAVGIEKATLFQEITRALGFQRTSEKITSKLNIAFEKLLICNAIEIKGNLVNIKTKN